jgi:hypothetical protein
MQNLSKLFKNWKKRLAFVCLAFLCLIGLPVFAQIQSVTTVQNLGFGAFTQGSNGGTITISGQGERSAAGSVILLNLGQTYYQALFDVAAPEGTIISFSNGPDATLSGSKGGAMSLRLGSPDPAPPFVTGPSGITRVSVGGTLTVGSSTASPPGNYTGTFYITFNNE